MGINYFYFHSIECLNSFTKRFYRLNSGKFRQFLLSVCNSDRTYIDTAFNQIYEMYGQCDFEQYYDKIRRLFIDNEIVVFAGGGVLKNLKYNLFELAKDVQYVNGPSKDAYFCIDEIMTKACGFDKNKTLCFILGPASKILVYRLNQLGYRAWDIGHMAKDYDFYMRKITPTDETIKAFYRPD